MWINPFKYISFNFPNISFFKPTNKNKPVKNYNQIISSTLKNKIHSFEKRGFLFFRKNYKINLIDSENKLITIKVKHLAKAFRIQPKYLEQAIKNNELQQFTGELDKALNIYKDQFSNFDNRKASLTYKKSGEKAELTTKQLMKITAKAFYVLKDQKHARIKSYKDKFLVSKSEDGEIFISKKVTKLGSGTFGKASLYATANLGKDTVVKFAKKKEPGAIEDIINEYKILCLIGGRRGLQDKPYDILDISADKIGFMGTRYDGDGLDLMGKITSEKDICDFMHQLFCGLNYLVKNNVRHQDIKPENLLFRNENDHFVVHISDFGGARTINPDDPIKNFKELTATKDFASKNDRNQIRALKKKLNSYDITPEEFKAESTPLYRAWDIYSTSITIYEVLTNTNYDALDHENCMNLLKATEIPKNLRKLLVKGLDQDYQKRPSSEDFLKAIEQSAPHLAALRTHEA